MSKKNMMIATARQLQSEGLLAEHDIIAVKNGGAILYAQGLCNLAEEGIVTLTAADAAEDAALLFAVFAAIPDANAIILNSAPFCMAVSAHAKKIPAVLDDMAQIIGPSAKVSKSASTADILKTLKGRNACLIRNKGVIAVGRTLDEAFVGSLVLEKGAKTYVEGVALGGAKPINIVEAALMHYIYKKKYSKIDQTAKMQEE